MAKVVVNRRADIYHNNGNNKVEFEDNLYRILSSNREYVNKLLSGEESYPDLSQPIPPGYIYPTRYSNGSWSDLMAEPFNTGNRLSVEFTQTGKTITMSSSPFAGFSKKPCVAVINCDIGNNVGVTLAAKLMGMYGGSYNFSEYWDDISFTFSAVLNITSSGGGSATLTFTTGKSVTVNSVEIYYKPNYKVADSVSGADDTLTPIVTPTVESESAETAITDWSSEAGRKYISASSVSTGSVGGYVLFDLTINSGSSYKVLAQGVNESIYAVGDTSKQSFTCGSYTVEIEVDSLGNYWVTALSSGSPVAVTINSALKYSKPST